MLVTALLKVVKNYNTVSISSNSVFVCSNSVFVCCSSKYVRATILSVKDRDLCPRVTYMNKIVGLQGASGFAQSRDKFVNIEIFKALFFLVSVIIYFLYISQLNPSLWGLLAGYVLVEKRLPRRNIFIWYWKLNFFYHQNNASIIPLILRFRVYSIIRLHYNWIIFLKRC